MKYFTKVRTLDELKKAYKNLCFVLHPDYGGDKYAFSEMKQEYDELFPTIKANEKKQKQETKQSTAYTEAQNVNDGFKEIIDLIVPLKDISIEICGLYIWVSGATKQYKDILKTAGFRWACKKKMWYWRPTDCPKIYTHGEKAMELIRLKYGSEKIFAGQSKKEIGNQVDTSSTGLIA